MSHRPLSTGTGQLCRPRTTRLRPVQGAAAAGLLLAGLTTACSSTPTRSSAPVAPAATASPAAPGGNPVGAPTSPAATPTQAAPTPGPPVTGCSTGQLRIGVNGGGAGAAGSVVTAVTFRNIGATTCTLRGHPGVTYVAGADGHQVGNPARPEFAGSLVTVPPGGVAHAALRIVNYTLFTPHQCQPRSVRGYLVVPPGQTVPGFSPIRGGRACSSPNISALTVGPVQLGPAGR